MGARYPPPPAAPTHTPTIDCPSAPIHNQHKNKNTARRLCRVRRRNSKPSRSPSPTHACRELQLTHSTWVCPLTAPVSRLRAIQFPTSASQFDRICARQPVTAAGGLAPFSILFASFAHNDLAAPKTTKRPHLRAQKRSRPERVGGHHVPQTPSDPPRPTRPQPHFVPLPPRREEGPGGVGKDPHRADHRADLKPHSQSAIRSARSTLPQPPTALPRRPPKPRPLLPPRRRPRLPRQKPLHPAHPSPRVEPPTPPPALARPPHKNPPRPPRHQHHPRPQYRPR